MTSVSVDPIVNVDHQCDGKPFGIANYFSTLPSSLPEDR